DADQVAARLARCGARCCGRAQRKGHRYNMTLLAVARADVRQPSLSGARRTWAVSASYGTRNAWVLSMSDFDDERARMVREHIAARGIENPQVLAAMRGAARAFRGAAARRASSSRHRAADRGRPKHLTAVHRRAD